MKYSNIKAIIFDFWGVFAKLDPPMNRALEDGGIDLDEFNQKYYNLVIAHDLGEINEKEFLEKTSEIFGVDLRFEKHRHLFKEDAINHNLIKIVKNLKNKYKIGLLTNNSEAYCKEFLFKPGLDKLFDEYVLSYQVGKRKPDPEIYLMIARKLGMKPQEILYIDDQENRIDPAAELGMETLIYEGEKTNKVLEELL